MSSIAEIPGFYYGTIERVFITDHLDAEKRKYFKIETHGNPSNPYSRDNIAKRRRAEEQQTRLEQETRLQIDQLKNLRPFQRWTHSAYNVRGYLNSREIGLSKAIGDRDNLQAKLIRRQRIWQIRHTESYLEQLTSFALDEDSGEAVLGTYGGLVSSMSTQTYDSTNIRLNNEPQTTVTRFTSQVTSISLSPDKNQEKTLVCCSLGTGYNSGTVHIGKFSREVEDRRYGLEVYSVMKPRKSQTLFCTTISRYTHGLFAVGGENVLFVSGGLHEQRPMLNIQSNCLAVEFLGEHTLAAGSRNGLIRYRGVSDVVDDRLYDLRGQPEIQMTDLMIQHPSSVTQMRQVDDHFLMIAGLENSVLQKVYP